MSGFLADTARLLVLTVFELFLFAVLLRFLFQLVRADFYNPVSQFIVALTNPLVKPLRRVIPGFFGIDFASLILLIAVKCLEIYLLRLIDGLDVPLLALVVAAALELVRLTLNVFFFAVIIRALLSWFSPYGIRHNPVGNLLVGLTEPLLGPARRLIPPVGGLDLSPIVVLVALQIALLALNHLTRFP
jgi:YggT family protein